MSAVPRFSTPRSPERANLETAARKLALVLGITLMPWQEHFIGLATEKEGDRRLAYTDVTLLVARQSGKSTALLVLLLLRALGTPGSKCYYCAQTLKDSRSMLLTTWVPLLDASGLAGSYDVRSANGSERIRFRNGSSIGLVTPTSTKSGHGLVVDMAVVDEAFSQVDSRVENALLPAMATRSNVGGGPQLLVVSTAGTPAGSPYLLQRVEHGRQLATAGITSGSAYIEYSAPDDCDPASPEVWAEANPALGHTITLDAIEAEWASLDRTDFQRSRLCCWTTAKVEPVVALDLWDELCDPDSQPGRDLVLSFDSAPDGGWSSIAVASVRGDDLLHVELVAREPGTVWLSGEVKRLVDAHKPFVVACDAKGAHANALPELAKMGVDVRELGAADAANAHTAFVTACQEKVLRHLDQPDLTAALTGAARRSLGDGYAWSRRSSSVDISPLVAVTEAAWAARTVARPHVTVARLKITPEAVAAAVQRREERTAPLLRRARAQAEQDWQDRLRGGGS